MIYVDPLMNYGWKMRGKIIESCHLITDSSMDSLHEFAEKIGLKRSWFQEGFLPHYDLTPNKRLQAVKKGAKEITIKQMAEFIGKARGYKKQKGSLV